RQIMDEVAQAFARERIKRQVLEIEDVEVLRGVIVQLMEVIEQQKRAVHKMLEADIKERIRKISAEG
ncbi:MAG: hypothetical protein EBZ22_05215, partial [Flavobacteriia bacterium]|nr:hypothetical protein [Flavobacteriia bacterium]